MKVESCVDWVFDLKICARKFELRDGSDMRHLVSCALSFGHKQRRQFRHRIDIQNFIRHEALSKHPSIPSLEFVPNTTPAALLIQMTALDKVAEMLLQRVSADTR